MANSERNSTAASDPTAAPSCVLVVTDVPYWKNNRGSSRRICSMIEHLRRHCQVSICYVGEMPVAQWNQAEKFFNLPFFGPGQPSGIARKLVRSLPFAKLQKSTYANKASSVATERPALIEDYHSDTIGNFVGELSNKLQIDVVIIQYITLTYVADFVRQHSPDTRTIVDTHDVMHMRNAEFKKAGMSSWLDIDAAQESVAISCCDASIAISDEDLLALQKLDSGKPVLKASYALTCQTQQSRPKLETNTTTLGFIGSDGDANQIGISQFLEISWPALVEHFGSAIRLRIAGPIDRAALDCSNLNIEFIGNVANLSDFYNSIDIAINPATIRSGFKIKSLEALAWGVPLVTTTAGIAGMAVAIGNGATVANDWNGFANAIIALAQNEAQRRQAANRALHAVREYFSPETVYAELVSWIGSSA